MNPKYPQRKNHRLPGYDYAQAGYYFITLCTQDRKSLFGSITQEGIFVENDFGRILRETWLDLPNHNPGVEVDIFVVMPNHFHGIVCIHRDQQGLPAGGRAGLEPTGLCPPLRNWGRLCGS